MEQSKKAILIIGPTATGKTKLAVNLAADFNGEILSADSRQVYKYMDIGTGKDVDKDSIFNLQFSIGQLRAGYYEYEEVKIWGLDIVDPDCQFSVSDYYQYAQVVLKDIWDRNKIPLIVGGTGQYLKVLLSPMQTLGIPINLPLRKSLEEQSILQLQKNLKDRDGKKWEQMNQSDRANSRRLIRAIEVGGYLVTHPVNATPKPLIKEKLIIGLKGKPGDLIDRIGQRVDKRLKQGIVDEVKTLMEKGYQWKDPSLSGLGYKEFKEFFEKGLSLSEVTQKWKIDELNYAKRQMTYFLKYFPEAIWYEIDSTNMADQIRRTVADFL